MPAQGKRKNKPFRSRLDKLVTEIEHAGASRSAPDVTDVAVMKPETRERPFSRPGWLFELKYDGFRMLAERRDGGARLLYRSGHDATGIFPEVARAVAALPFDLILDGEAVVLDAAGRPAFQLLQRRGQRTRRVDADHAAAASPATFFVFDLLALAGYDLRPLPLALRKDLLSRSLALAKEATEASSLIHVVEAVEERGEDFYAAVVGLGLEGVVGKRGDSPYKGGVSPHWLKVRVDQSADFAIVGFEPEGKTGLRNLHLAAIGQDGGWDYVGVVGSGLAGQQTREIRARLEALRRPQAAAGAPSVRRAVWVEPELVCEVRYKEWTEDGNLRQPVFLRLRDDKRPEECTAPVARH
jgi:bifunctional non-homologous end joining protein LigD